MFSLNTPGLSSFLPLVRTAEQGYCWPFRLPGRITLFLPVVSGKTRLRAFGVRKVEFGVRVRRSSWFWLDGTGYRFWFGWVFFRYREFGQIFYWGIAVQWGTRLRWSWALVIWGALHNWFRIVWAVERVQFWQVPACNAESYQDL